MKNYDPKFQLKNKNGITMLDPIIGILPNDNLKHVETKVHKEINSNSPWNLKHKTEVFSSTDDIIVLSVTRKRIQEKGAYFSITDPTVYKSIREDDISLARTIRDFYAKKLLWLAIKNSNGLSKFRTELSNLINSNGKTITSNLCRLAYHLPDFYEYDVGLESIKRETKSSQETRYKFRELKLAPLKRLSNMSSKVNEYWFKSLEDDTAKMIPVAFNNSLDSVWRTIYESSDVLCVNGIDNLKIIDSFRFGVLNKWIISVDK